MFCHKCGSKIKDGTKFCPKCGTMLSNRGSKKKEMLNTNVQQLKTKIEHSGFNIISLYKKYYLDTIRNKFALFKGKATRKEFWYFTLFDFATLFALFLFDVILVKIVGARSSIYTFYNILGFLFLFGLLIPRIAIGVRRLHDVNMSGWFYLVNLIPYLGIILFLWAAVQPSRSSNS